MVSQLPSYYQINVSIFACAPPVKETDNNKGFPTDAVNLPLWISDFPVDNPCRIGSLTVAGDPLVRVFGRAEVRTEALDALWAFRTGVELARESPGARHASRNHVGHRNEQISNAFH